MAELPSFDPYRVLGVDKSSESIEIKKAFRKLALLKHPDKCTDESLRQSRTDEFQRLNEAYAILGDDDKRRRHDALVKLDALRKEKASLGGPPRPFQRSSTFSSGYPAGPNTPYTSRGSANVEDRAPRFASDEDDSNSYPRRHSEYDDYRRPATGSMRERTQADRDADERRRGERRRDAGIREARSRKYDYPDEKTDAASRYDDDQRRRDRARSDDPVEKSRSKYEEMEENIHRYTGVKMAKPPMETRPSVGRRQTSTREVPRPAAFVRRSQASPRESTRSQRDIDDEQEILDRERRRLREMKDKLERAQEEKERRRERERREADRELDSDRLEREGIRSRERETARSNRNREHVEPYDRRPPPLQHASSAPPYLRDEPSPRESISRTRTEPPSASAHLPSMPRSNTMPSVPSNTSSKRTAQPSKLRESSIPDPGYSSSSTGSDHKPKTTAKPVRKYIYTRESSDDKLPRGDERTPRRGRSPSPERPSSNATKLANLANLAKMVNSVKTEKIASRRPSAVHSSSSSRNIPLRTRSPDRISRRELDRDRDYTRDIRDPLFGERTPRSPREIPRNVSYSKEIRDEDIIYNTNRPMSGRKERGRDSYAYPHPGLQRGNTMPISAGQ